MKNELHDLWINKNEQHGRINITIFFINIFLLLCHIFLMVIYALINHKFMMGINVISLILYSVSIFKCYKKSLFYAGIAFLEIWLHMLCAIASFGWEPCFQNWSFAIIAAYFLPVFGYNNKSSYKTTLFYTSFVVITYFTIAIVINKIDLPIYLELSNNMKTLLFILNNLITFFTIIMFSIFYTLNNKRKERELTRKADFDELTSLYNRYALTQISERVIKEAEIQKKHFSVAILDLDFFKEINDTYGHGAGDSVLEEIANILRSFSLKGIVSGRWGGEEFVMIAPSNIHYSEFLKILGRLREKISSTEFKIEENKTIKLTISIGAAKINNYCTLDEAISMADLNLYCAKNEGRNKVIG